MHPLAPTVDSNHSDLDCLRDYVAATYPHARPLTALSHELDHNACVLWGEESVVWQARQRPDGTWELVALPVGTAAAQLHQDTRHTRGRVAGTRKHEGLHYLALGAELAGLTLTAWRQEGRSEQAIAADIAHRQHETQRSAGDGEQDRVDQDWLLALHAEHLHHMATETPSAVAAALGRDPAALEREWIDLAQREAILRGVASGEPGEVLVPRRVSAHTTH